MSNHKFTPEQSELILNAVSKCFSTYFSFHHYSKFVSDLCTDRILDSIECPDPEKPEERELNLTTNHLERIVLDNAYLQDFFLELGTAVKYKTDAERIAEAHARQKVKEPAEAV